MFDGSISDKLGTSLLIGLILVILSIVMMNLPPWLAVTGLIDFGSILAWIALFIIFITSLLLRFTKK